MINHVVSCAHTAFCDVGVYSFGLSHIYLPRRGEHMMKKRGRIDRLHFPKSQGWHMLLLSGFFTFGAILGHVTAQVVGVDFQLQETIIGLASQQPDSVSPSLWTILVGYLRFPLLALLLGYCNFALLAVPALMSAFGFSLSFSASALAVSLGTAGITLALASFGLRSLVTIVCTIIPAIWSFNRAAGTHSEKTLSAGIIGICFFLVILAVILELTVLPMLFSSALTELYS